jgi:hypothetical protein
MTTCYLDDTMPLAAMCYPAAPLVHDTQHTQYHTDGAICLILRCH